MLFLKINPKTKLVLRKHCNDFYSFIKSFESFNCMHENGPSCQFQKLFGDFCSHSFSTSSRNNYYVQIHNLSPPTPQMWAFLFCFYINSNYPTFLSINQFISYLAFLHVLTPFPSLRSGFSSSLLRIEGETTCYPVYSAPSLRIREGYGG